MFMLLGEGREGGCGFLGEACEWGLRVLDDLVVDLEGFLGFDGLWGLGFLLSFLIKGVMVWWSGVRC